MPKRHQRPYSHLAEESRLVVNEKNMWPPLPMISQRQHRLLEDSLPSASQRLPILEGITVQVV